MLLAELSPECFSIYFILFLFYFLLFEFPMLRAELSTRVIGKNTLTPSIVEYQEPLLEIESLR